MSRYSIGKPEPEPKLPTASAGEWKSEPAVLSLQTRLKLVVRVPEDLRDFGPGFDVAAERFELALRQLVADVLVCCATNGFRVVGAVVEQFQDAGG